MVVDFSVVCPNRSGNLGPGIPDLFYQITNQKIRFPSVPPFRHFLPFSQASKNQFCEAQNLFFKSFGGIADGVGLYPS